MWIFMIIKKANKNNLTEITNLLLKELKKPPFNENYNFKDAKKSIEFYYNLGKMFIAKEINK